MINNNIAEKIRKTLSYHATLAVRDARARYWDLVRPRAERPVFIVGCSRAGTTLVYKTFSESAELGSLQKETHDFWADLHPPAERDWDSHEIPLACAGHRDRERVTRYFYAQTGKSRFVDKNNQNGLSIPYLLALFPDAHFVYVKRAPGDNVLSLMEGWNRADEFATWSDSLPEPISVGNGTHTRWCFFLADGWRNYAQAPLEDVCAFQYRAMNQVILAAKSSVPAQQWTEIVYEQLLDEPVGGFRAAFARCELTFTPELERHCAAVLSKPYNAFSAIKADKWRESPLAPRVERVLPQVAEIAAQMGYAT